MKESIVARRYAKAMVESYSHAELEAVGADLAVLAKAYQDSRDFQNVMQNPAIPESVKSAVLSDILEKTEVAKKTETALGVIQDNGRIGILPQIAEEFKSLSYVALGKVRVEVRSAMDLSGKELDEVTNKLNEITGKKAVIEVTVDPSLIGGIVAKVGSIVYDGSVANQLRALKVSL